MSRRALIIAGCVAVAAAAVALPLLMAMNSGADVGGKEVAAYEVQVSEAIKAVPLIKECSPPLYDHFEATDENPEVFALSYTSHAEIAEVAEGLSDYFTGESCREIAGGALGDGFLCPDGSEAYFDLRPKDQCTFVSVALLPAP